MDGIFLTEQVKILNSDEFLKLPFPSKEWDNDPKTDLIHA
jgi:hypothetical protein